MNRFYIQPSAFPHAVMACDFLTCDRGPRSCVGVDDALLDGWIIRWGLGLFGRTDGNMKRSIARFVAQPGSKNGMAGSEAYFLEYR